MDIEDDDDDIYDDIVRLRQTTRRTNWRHRATSLSQRDVALAVTINSSLTFYIIFIYIYPSFSTELVEQCNSNQQ